MRMFPPFRLLTDFEVKTGRNTGKRWPEYRVVESIKYWKKELPESDGNAPILHFALHVKNKW